MYQKIIVVGNLGRDPEMRYMPDGTAVTSFSMATNRRWTDRNTGQPVDETTWFRVSVWGRQAEAVNQYLSKGRTVLVEGQLRADPQTGGPPTWLAQDGTTRASFEIRADTVRFVGGRGDEGGGGAFDENSQSGGREAPQEEDDIPF
jgi:single-strand DNA-binding protein